MALPLMLITLTLGVTPLLLKNLTIKSLEKVSSKIKRLSSLLLQSFLLFCVLKCGIFSLTKKDSKKI